MGRASAHRLRHLRLGDRLRICGQVAEALDYAHIQGVIHRDVKPGNVLLTPSDEAKLSDFGLSLVAVDRIDQSGTIRGTPSYMSPEQAQGKPLDHRTDLYSVGVMLYECATGQVPFAGSMMSVIDQHIHATPTAPRFKNPELSSTLESLILSLMEKRPTKRPPSGNVVALALFEEAERALRLERINPGLRRSDPLVPTYPPPSSTLTVGKPKAEPTPAHAEKRVGRQAMVPSATDALLSALHKLSDTSRTPPSPAEDILDVSRNGREAAPRPYSHPIASEMLTTLLAKPIVITPEERYLCGHYLAYLLGGSRRRGLFLRRSPDARNADRARLLLSMAWLSCIEPTQEAIDCAAHCCKTALTFAPRSVPSW